MQDFSQRKEAMKERPNDNVKSNYSFRTMYSTAGAVHGVSSHHSCRCLRALPWSLDGAGSVTNEDTETTDALERDEEAAKAVVGFLIGTQSLVTHENEVHFLEFKEDLNTVSSKAVFSHEDEIWDIAPHPSRADLLLTVGASGLKRTGRVLRMNKSEMNLDQVASLPEVEGKKLRRLFWHPVEDYGTGEEAQGLNERFISVNDGLVRLWDMTHDLKKLDNIGTCTLPGNRTSTKAACWDPHHVAEFATGHGENIAVIDLRSMKVMRKIDQAHGLAVRDIDYNPNKPYHVVSGGQDRKIKFWDFRKTLEPVKVITAHTHWVNSVQYNKFHDQLVLASSTDSFVSLWRLSSISSAPLLEVDDDDENASKEDESAESEERASLSRGGTPTDSVVGSSSDDGLVKFFDDHSESVYSVAWGATNAWIFASLSYDGNFVVNHVPSSEKYKILL